MPVTGSLRNFYGKGNFSAIQENCGGVSFFIVSIKSCLCSGVLGETVKSSGYWSGGKEAACSRSKLKLVKGLCCRSKHNIFCEVGQLTGAYSSQNMLSIEQSRHVLTHTFYHSLECGAHWMDIERKASSQELKEAVREIICLFVCEISSSRNNWKERW